MEHLCRPSGGRIQGSLAIQVLWEFQEAGLGLDMLSSIWKGPELEDGQEGNLEARWSPGGFSTQDQVSLS